MLPFPIDPDIFEKAKCTSEVWPHTCSVQDQKEDASHAFHALQTHDIHVTWEENASGPGYRVRVYHPYHALALSDLNALLEDVGLHLQTHESYQWSFPPQGHVWVYAFVGLLCARSQPLSPLQREQVCLGLHHVWKGHVRRSALNRLLIEEGFPWRSVELLNAMVDYLRQVRPSYDSALIESTLLSQPELAILWTQAFSAKFDPSLEDRSAYGEALHTLCARLPALSQPQSELWGALTETLRTLVRTNFYQKVYEGWKPYMAFKHDHSLVSGSTQGIRYEIFVSAPFMQGVHFRAGSVARGGIRWSDRLGDFRREIWDLTQTQILKNAIIVPTGAKGGFVVTQTTPHQTRAEHLAQGQKAYTTLIHGLLDVTDNQVGGEVVRPAESVCYDAPDPYLVVAADKGTASFSDLANSVSGERGFWLGDAFASGGSYGYDHKKLGITSRGAWESFKRHAHHLGWKDSQIITVVGVGDMSGDVFGNGMLLSSSLQLIGAFNHRHIFLDPHPDPVVSFQERQRLFHQPGSQWSDYNPSLISEGGGVWERTRAEIFLSEPARQRLHLAQDKISPSALIRALLKAPVDMLWLGGVGTFVKGSQEDDLALGDPLNPWVRIHGGELHAQMVIEGANLGVTQAGRIQYAHKGGRINTDTIDNSAGVHCSDYEVNLKILLNQAVRDHRISEEERRTLLSVMTPQVVAKILSQNFQHNQILSYAERESKDHPEEYGELRKTLKSVRKLGYPMARWPSERVIMERGLTRPDLCLILAHSKIWLKHCLLHNTTWSSDRAVRYALQHYMPQTILEDPRFEVARHPLCSQIVATVWTNEAINRWGPCVIVQKGGRLSPPKLVERMTALTELLMNPEIHNLWTHIDRTSLLEPFEVTYQHYRSFKGNYTSLLFS